MDCRSGLAGPGELLSLHLQYAEKENRTIKEVDVQVKEAFVAVVFITPSDVLLRVEWSVHSFYSNLQS
eukprot:764998-Hanusia_phi.AAC.2